MDYLVAGDSAYPISAILMKPYSLEEARIDANKRLFNAVRYIDYTCKLAMLLSVWSYRSFLSAKSQTKGKWILFSVMVI
jgi:hypothetical protein